MSMRLKWDVVTLCVIHQIHSRWLNTALLHTKMVDGTMIAALLSCNVYVAEVMSEA